MAKAETVKEPIDWFKICFRILVILGILTTISLVFPMDIDLSVDFQVKSYVLSTPITVGFFAWMMHRFKFKNK